MPTTDTITVPEIHCGHCRDSIEGALRPMAGVEEADVDIDARTVTVVYDEAALDVAAIIATIEEQGYDVPPQGSGL